MYPPTGPTQVWAARTTQLSVTKGSRDIKPLMPKASQRSHHLLKDFIHSYQTQLHPSSPSKDLISFMPHLKSQLAPLHHSAWTHSQRQERCSLAVSNTMFPTPLFQKDFLMFHRVAVGPHSSEMCLPDPLDPKVL